MEDPAGGPPGRVWQYHLAMSAISPALWTKAVRISPPVSSGTSMRAVCSAWHGVVSAVSGTAHQACTMASPADSGTTPPTPPSPSSPLMWSRNRLHSLSSALWLPVAHHHSCMACGRLRQVTEKVLSWRPHQARSRRIFSCTTSRPTTASPSPQRREEGSTPHHQARASGWRSTSSSRARRIAAWCRPPEPEADAVDERAAESCRFFSTPSAQD
mmetsp:Transcript_26461/g.77131  ORF Transcript_26461/g.77131 Transcript_26461/m.77131 type:complete len:214 (-) Transcript_26461:100-741(-)